MRAFASIRAKRRLSFGIVALLLVLGGLASLHHHKLVPTADEIALTSARKDDHPARAFDCVVCRAVDPVRLVAARGAAPPVLVGFALPEGANAAVAPSVRRTSSPRAPPVSA